MKNLTDIVVLLDRSGSMESVRTDTVGGLNAFITEQKGLPGEARFTLMQFDSQGFDKPVDYKPVKDVPLLTPESFQPRASTPLLDSMARMITETGQRLEATPESDRPDKVVVVILTDGQENASREFTREQVFEMVKHQTETYGWLFLYLGANQDAIDVGARLGISSSHSASYSGTGAGTRRAHAVASNLVAQRRAGATPTSVGYSTEQREQLKTGQ